MGKQLSNDQKLAYLIDPECCPFCKAESLRAGYTDYDGIYATRYITCNTCRENFYEQFEMVTISQLEFDEEDITFEDNYIVVEQKFIGEGIWDETNNYIREDGD